MSITTNNKSLPRDKRHKNKADDEEGKFYDSFKGAGDKRDIDHHVKRTLEEVNPAWLPRKLDTNTFWVIYRGVESGIQQSTTTISEQISRSSKS